jgi:glutamate-5-semialdehyde dehydrogenase
MVTSAPTPRLQAKAHDHVQHAIEQARAAGQAALNLGAQARSTALSAAADALSARIGEVLRANELDLRAAAQSGLPPAALRALEMTDARVAGLADDLRRMSNTADPLDDLPDHAAVVRVPLGVIGAVYEAHPTVTIAIGALSIRAGNAVLLRAGAAAQNTNAALVAALHAGLDLAGLPTELVAAVPATERSTIRYLMGARDLVDLVLVRGGLRMMRMVLNEASVPVITLGPANSHIYLDSTADPQLIGPVVSESMRDPSGSVTVLAHSALASQSMGVLTALGSTISPTDEQPERDSGAGAVTFVVVDSMKTALEHINRAGGGHTEVIVTADLDTARRFASQVDAATIGVNVPIEINSSTLYATQKLHARGVLEPRHLTTTKRLVWH